MTSTVWHTGTELFAPPKPNLANEKLQRLREQLEEKRLEMETREAEIRLNRLEHVRNRSERLARLVEGPVAPVPASSPTPRSLTESVNNTDYALTAYADLINRFTDSGIAPYPLTSIADRRWGHNWPFWRSENELAIWRARGRLLCGMSANAQGLQNGLDSYIIGKGFKWEFKPKKGSVIDKGIVEQGQRLLDDFLEKNRWSQFERESRNRGGEDGEVFIRMFPNTDGTMSVRFIEPEQVRDLSRHGVDGTYGIVTKPDDINEVVSYSVSYVAPGGSAKEGDDEDVPAADIVHIKRNVKSGVKRGLTDFSFGTADAFENASKLLRNMGLGAAVQAAIAGIRQHDVATSAQVDTFLAVDTAYQQQNPGTGQTDSYQVLDAGSFLDIPKGQNYVPPPGAANGPAHLSIQQALLRTAGARYNAPEWLCSGDASNGNYASSLTAESPFVKSCESEQHFYGKHFKLVITAFTLNAVKAGLIPDYFLDLVDVTYTPPRVQTRNAAEEATTSDVYLRNKVTSPQIVAAQQGLEWDQVEADWEEYEERFGAAPSPLPGMDDGSDDELGDDDGGDKPTPPKPPKKPAPITEDYEPKHDSKTGQFTGNGGGSGKAEPQKIGKGSTGDVFKVGDEVHKTAKGKTEGKVYSELKGAVGIAQGREEGGKIVTPHFKNIVSRDDVPLAQRKSMHPVITKAFPDIASGITTLSRAGYSYNDPLQVGFDKDRKAHIFDFSNAEKKDPKEALSDNLGHLGDYLQEFGSEKLANGVKRVGSVLHAMHHHDNDFMADDEDMPHAKKILAHLDGKEPNNLYFATNARTIPGVAQTEHTNGYKVIASEKPLSDEFIKTHELTPVVHEAPKRNKATEAKKPKHDPKTGQFTGDGRSDEEHPKHTVALPKNKKTLSLGATHEAMKQMGYGLGDSNYDPKTKQMTYDVKLPSGETKKVSTDDLKALIYKHAKLKESRQSRRKIPERWVTIGAKKSKDGGPKKGGTPVELDSRGKIVKGPSKMVGKKPHQLDVAYGTPGAPKADKEDIRKKANQLIGQKKRGELHQMLGTLGHRELKSLAKEHGLRTPGGKKELVRSIAAQMTTDYHGKRKVHKDARAANVHPQAVEDRAREIHALNMETHKLEKSVRSEVAKQYAAYNGKRMPSYKELQGKDIESLKSYDVIVDSLRKAPETKRFFAGLNREESEQKVMDLISNKPSPAPSRTSAREEALQQLQDNPDAAYWRKGRAKAATSHDDGFTPFSDQF